MRESGSVVVVKAKNLIDGSGRAPLQDVAVRIDGNVISEVGSNGGVDAPQSARVIDLGDRTLMPGMVDAHIHFFGVPSDKFYHLGTESESYRVLRAAGEAKRMLEAGITAARCLGSSVSPALRRGIAEGHVPGPRLVAAGQFVTSSRGTWAHIEMGVPMDAAKADMLADGVDGVRAIVRRRIREGANVIKVGLSNGLVDDRLIGWGEEPTRQTVVYSPEEISALTDEAHRHKLKVSAHCIGDEPVRSALAGGVDVIEHGHGINDETRRMLVDRNAVIVSTLAVMRYFDMAADRYGAPDWQRAAWRRHIEAISVDFQRGVEAGVRYALGSDLLGYPTHPQDQATREFEFAVECGMDPMAAIVAGTRVSAEVLGLEDSIGTVEAGKLADMIAVEDDPLGDITTLQRVGFVLQDGEVIVNKYGE